MVKNFNTDFEKLRHIDGIRHVKLGKRNVKKLLPPSPSAPKPIFTATKIAMAGFTVRGIESEISYLQYEWPVFCAKELMDNSYEFLTEFYPNASRQDRKISLHVCPINDNDSDAIRIAVKNSNVNVGTPVFENLQANFDFSIWYSSKRNQHKGGPGWLGDALKRMIKMGYASYIESFDGRSSSEDSFIDRQWDEPIVLTFNGQQFAALLRVERMDKDNSDAMVVIDRINNAIIDNNDTEVSVALPRAGYDYDTIVSRIRKYYDIYKIPKSRIDFSFTAEGVAV